MTTERASGGESAASVPNGAHERTVSLRARAPFDWHASLEFLGSFPALRGEQTIGEASLVKAWRFADRTIVAELTAQGDDALRCRLGSATELTDDLVAAASDRISFFLGLDDDLSPFYKVAAQDPAFSAVVAQLRGYHQVKLPSPVENICWAILSQRAPMAVARTLKGRLMAAFDNDLTAWGQTYRPFPSQEQLTALGPDELISILGNTRKGAYLHCTLAGLAGVDEEFLRHGDYDRVRELLLSLPGIGPWSASFVLIRGLGRMERLPDGDEVLKVASAVYGRPLDERGLAEIAEPYGEYRGYWAHYLRACG
ncbi:hypothetical protein [Pengzhenrongella sp.]|uniref:DNA-3-methyladenine glycosylase family protein n=1 Tax=Pengzhenrongella sp. TaxID=2888820 RepID=UPI002F95C2AE